MIVTFGKYKGKEISELPLDYLAWGAMNLNNKWKSLFLEAYTTKLQESDFKYRVFRDNLSFLDAFSMRLDIFQALMLFKREWSDAKYIIRELKDQCLIFPCELPNHKKLILDEALEYYENEGQDSDYEDDDWLGIYDF